VRTIAIVNANARRLSRGVRQRLERARPGQVRFTASLDDARATIRAEVRRGVDQLVLGGGDGTVVMGLALLAEACRGSGRPEMPIGVLRLGSGNAIADAVGASDDPVADLELLARGRGVKRELAMIDVLGVRAPFVGVGIDAQLLEDEQAVSRVIDGVPVARSVIGGAARYALSVALRSLPRFATTERAHAIVTNAGAPATPMTAEGPRHDRAPTGQQLWEGTCTLVAGATIPYFGFGMRMFPFAGARADRFHLRCGDAGLVEIVRNAPAAFRGEYFSPNVRDYLCERVDIELDREVAVEAGGELLGRHRRIELALGAPITVRALA